jgi:replication factor A1
MGMHIKDIKAKMGKIDVVADVISKEAPRTFDKFGKAGKVCDARIKDATGEVKLTLWNDQADLINVGDKIHLTDGYADEFRGTMQVSTGKFGALEVVSKGGSPAATPDKEVQEMSEELGDEFDELEGE